MSQKIRSESASSSASRTATGGLSVTAEVDHPKKFLLKDSAGDVWGTRQVRRLDPTEMSAGQTVLFEGERPVPGMPTLVPPAPSGDLPVALERTTAPDLRVDTLHLEPMAQVPEAVGAWPGSEVRTLVQQGPSSNRIDLSIAGDGYTVEEKDKFFADAEKITRELFGNDTFKTYLPLFNVHAVFVPSKESGIGDGNAKNTALKLYRHPTLRQAIMPGDTGGAKRATNLAPDCDYPILVANDRFYGGLGGAFAITSSAPLNITTVLRHELGHNFGRVGEEYDGGQVYSGANHSSTANVPWKHFVQGDAVPVHRAQLLHYSAPWKNLSQGVWQTAFKLDKTADILLDFSSLGFDTAQDVTLLVDNKPVEYSGRFNYDRNFYHVRLTLEAGPHIVTFKENTKDGNNTLSKVGIYSVPPDYPKDKNLVGAFATYDEGSRFIGYRPTDAGCLMRDMSSHKFCDACTENMWRSFLNQVNLIDGVHQNGSQVHADLLPLGAERLRVEWMDPQGKVRDELTGKTDWTPKPSDAGTWTLRVGFVSDEVKDPRHTDWSVHQSKVNVAFGAVA